MRKLISLMLVVGLANPSYSYAATNPLGTMVKTLSISKDMNDFMDRTLVKDKAFLAEVKAYTKKHNIIQLPKFRFEKDILTIIAPDKTTMTFEIIDAENGDFKINGKPMNVSVVDDANTITQKIEMLITQKNASVWNFILPQAEAILFAIAVGVVVGVTLIGGVWTLMPTGCRKVAKDLNRLIGETNKGSHTSIYVTQIESCQLGESTIYINDSLESQKPIKLTYKKSPMDPEGTLIEELDENPQRKITYAFEKSSEGLEAVFKGASQTVDGVSGPVSETTTGRTQANFKIYQKVAHAFTNRAGESCNKCDKEELLKKIKQPGQQAMPSATKPSAQ